MYAHRVGFAHPTGIVHFSNSRALRTSHAFRRHRALLLTLRIPQALRMHRALLRISEKPRSVEKPIAKESVFFRETYAGY